MKNKITKVKFKGATYHGKNITFSEDIEHPEDIDALEYLDSIDKKYLMDKYDLGFILNYEVYFKNKINKISKKELIFKFIVEHFSNNEQLYYDFMAAYAFMEKSIKKLKAVQQIEIVLSSLDMSYTAQSKAHTDIKNIFLDFKNKQNIKCLK